MMLSVGFPIGPLGDSHTERWSAAIRALRNPEPEPTREHGMTAEQQREHWRATNRDADTEVAAKLAALRAENALMREVLVAVDEWDIRWADGLDINVERIKSMVRSVLGSLKGEGHDG